jgi:hypothetical protein
VAKDATFLRAGRPGGAVLLIAAVSLSVPRSAAAEEVAASPAPAPATLAEGYRPRAGRIFWRVMVGPGITDFEVAGLSDSRAVTYNFTASVGYAVFPNVILALEMDSAGAPDSGAWFNVNGDWTNETSLGYLSLGPALIAYAPFNSHASLSVGFTTFTLRSDLPEQDLFFEVQSKVGLAGTLTLGHDFRLSKRWWLGGAAQLFYARATGDDLFFEEARVTARGASLMLTVGTQ